MSTHSILPLFRDCLKFYRDQIGIYFPSYEQETKIILNETPKEFYVSDELPIYERYYRRYRRYLGGGDLEIALYSLYVALETITRTYIELKSKDSILKSQWSLEKLMDEVKILDKDFENFYQSFAVLNAYRNQAVHGYGFSEKDTDSIIHILNRNDIFYNEIKDKVEKEQNK